MTHPAKTYLSLREDRYRPIFSRSNSFAPIKRIWRAVLGDQYLEEIDAFGFVTATDLQDIADAVGPLAGRTLVDIGCGGGGPGLWVARRTGADLVGIDILQEAVDQAAEFSKGFADAPRASFRVGSFTGTKLPAASAAAVMSVDAFWMVMDKLKALEEVARIMAPGGVFAMTTWADANVVWPEWFEDTGLQVVSCRETRRWKENQLAVYEAVSARREELAAVLDPAALAILLSEAEEAPKAMASMRRSLVIARRVED
ncbi:MAG: methyltransferase domain-containing protein [Pseudomonadota bacterium]